MRPTVHCDFHKSWVLFKNFEQSGSCSWFDCSNFYIYIWISTIFMFKHTMPDWDISNFYFCIQDFCELAGDLTDDDASYSQNYHKYFCSKIAWVSLTWLPIFGSFYTIKNDLWVKLRQFLKNFFCGNLVIKRHHWA